MPATRPGMAIPEYLFREQVMLRSLLKSKIHRARVTDGNVNYEGSITIPVDMLRVVDLWEGEKVLVISVNSGARLETYV